MDEHFILLQCSYIIQILYKYPEILLKHLFKTLTFYHVTIFSKCMFICVVFVRYILLRDLYHLFIVWKCVYICFVMNNLFSNIKVWCFWPWPSICLAASATYDPFPAQHQQGLWPPSPHRRLRPPAGHMSPCHCNQPQLSRLLTEDGRSDKNMEEKMVCLWQNEEKGLFISVCLIFFSCYIIIELNKLLIKPVHHYHQSIDILGIGPHHGHPFSLSAPCEA